MQFPQATLQSLIFFGEAFATVSSSRSPCCCLAVAVVLPFTTVLLCASVVVALCSRYFCNRASIYSYLTSFALGAPVLAFSQISSKLRSAVHEIVSCGTKDLDSSSQFFFQDRWGHSRDRLRESRKLAMGGQHLAESLSLFGAVANFKRESISLRGGRWASQFLPLRQLRGCRNRLFAPSRVALGSL